MTYDKELAHMIMKTEKSQDLLSRPRNLLKTQESQWYSSSPSPSLKAGEDQCSSYKIGKESKYSFTKPFFPIHTISELDEAHPHCTG